MPASLALRAYTEGTMRRPGRRVWWALPREAQTEGYEVWDNVESLGKGQQRWTARSEPNAGDQHAPGSEGGDRGSDVHGAHRQLPQEHLRANRLAHGHGVRHLQDGRLEGIDCLLQVRMNVQEHVKPRNLKHLQNRAGGPKQLQVWRLVGARHDAFSHRGVAVFSRIASQ
jgi:hypothetical protein